ncbi:Predicted oxidoreductase [Flavobacterium sp. 9AF]|uniref:aldo/keto reductase n=1 Tax=Flavobacterium sp. 9AF TaxID=2653142 RepID=UPI0012F2C677|nr:aldo/keto reductase [Flavobacterium sp. 9AF]VXC13246.1 Predicted oxidoreductase [Flavobacterium sp. 9AF]
MKLALGTVQFGLKYGISNNKGVPTDSDLKAIFHTSIANNICTFDTAIAYGNAEERISNFLPFHADIISKFPKTDSKSELETIILNSISRLKRDNLYGFMAHNGDFLIENPQLWEVLVKLKQENKIQKIGYSLYTTEQLEHLLTLKLIPDIIQIPFSLLDQKFGPYFKDLKSKGVEIHCRSVFLQGLYFLDLNALPEKIVPLKNELFQLRQIAKKYEINMNDLALNFAYTNSYIDKVVIGVENAIQLEENILSIQNWKSNDFIFEEINAIQVMHKELLNPVNW